MIQSRLPSAAERALETRLLQLGPDLPPASREYRFAPGRKWAFDFCYPDALLAVEVDGGTHAPRGGRHNTDGDRAKLNAAAALGWRVLRFSPAMLDRDPAGCVAAIRAALAQACYTEAKPCSREGVYAERAAAHCTERQGAGDG